MISDDDIQTYSQFMHRLADMADDIARRYFKQPIGHELKADASPVTIADQEIEMALVAKIRSAFPDHGIFGEETRRHNESAPLQWVIDPIDGTRAFIAGKPTFTTLISLCVEGAPKLGLISQAIQKKRWLGVSNVFARSLSDEAIRQQTNNDCFASLAMTEARIATTSMAYFSPKQAMGFAALEKVTATTLLNHDALAAGLLADGSIDILVESGLKPYDFAALVPIIEAAGGVITDFAGAPLTLASDGTLIAAANITLHKQALELLQGGA